MHITYLFPGSANSVLDDSVFGYHELFRIALRTPDSLDQVQNLTRECGPLARKHAHEIFDAIEAAVHQLKDSSLSQKPVDEGEKSTGAEERKTEEVRNSLNDQEDSENKQCGTTEVPIRSGSAPEGSEDTQGVQDFSGSWTVC